MSDAEQRKIFTDACDALIDTAEQLRLKYYPPPRLDLGRHNLIVDGLINGFIHGLSGLVIQADGRNTSAAALEELVVARIRRSFREHELNMTTSRGPF